MEGTIGMGIYKKPTQTKFVLSNSKVNFKIEYDGCSVNEKATIQQGCIDIVINGIPIGWGRTNHTDLFIYFGNNLSTIGMVPTALLSL